MEHTGPTTSDTYHFLEGGGELGELTRNFNWADTPVGPVDDWSASLRTMVGVLLHSKFPMVLFWGDDLIQFYNDAYRPSLGTKGKHPQALGQKGEECWPEIWENIYPMIEKVKTSGEAFFRENELLPIYRNGKLEDVYWTFNYSPVIGERGNIEGVLVICTETTAQVNAIRSLEQARDLLTSSETNLRNIILNAPVAMCILKGLEFSVEVANDRMYELWGITAEEIIDKPFFDELPEFREQGFEEHLIKVYTTGETFRANSLPVQVPRNQGLVTVYLNFVYEALRDGDGNINGVMAVAVEVTEEVNARKLLEESENLLRSIVENAPFPIGVYLGKEMRIELVNQAIIDVWGKGPDVVGKLYSEVLPELKDQHIYPQLAKVYSTGVPFHARNQRVDLVVDGILQQFYFNYSFTPLFDVNGNVYGIMNTAADVTDLFIAKQKVEQNEKNFRNMVKQAPVAMCIMRGPDHIVEVANDLFLELWGKSRVDVLNKPIFQGLPFTRSSSQKALLDNVFHKGRTYHADERPVTYYINEVQKTGYQNFVYEPYRASDGTILGILTIAIDVTEQVQARHKIEEVVAERTRDLQKSNAELTQFAYITSHDLQEPARKIRTFSEMLGNSLGDDIDEKAKRYVTKIENSATRMLTLIRDILAISQLSSIRTLFTPVNLATILAETLNDFELLIEQKMGCLDYNHLPTIDAIPIQMRQLFGNLISNALKFAKPDMPIQISIKASTLSKDEINSYPSLRKSESYISLAFQDNGIGFNQENAEQIFDIFQRLHAKSEYEGTGIGLAMCKKIVDNHGGHINVQSSPGEGAMFTVILPVTQDQTSPFKEEHSP